MFDSLKSWFRENKPVAILVALPLAVLTQYAVRSAFLVHDEAYLSAKAFIEAELGADSKVELAYFDPNIVKRRYRADLTFNVESPKFEGSARIQLKYRAGEYHVTEIVWQN